jgi:predicted flap endonuclease-1-like 5' DNA nuclease
VPAQRVAEPETAVAPDNLVLIEGIGPKMAKALAAAGITTFERLATSDVATIRAAVAAAGMRASASLPTWPRQARQLANGGNGSAELNGGASADLEVARS